MNCADLYLKDNIKNILENGYKDKDPRPKYEDGSPAHTYFVTHVLRTYNLSCGEFPITTLRPIAWKSAIKEMLWIFQDQSISLKVLQGKYNNHVWDQWESKIVPGTIGCRYGHTVKIYDLINKLIKDIKENPYGRYHIINLWQEEEFLRSDGLKPCAYETIWSVRGEYLDMFLNQRSGDMLVASGAGCWNEVQYAALLLMIAHETGYKPGKFSHMVVNEQIYDRHIKQAKEMLYRQPSVKNPRISLNAGTKGFYDITIDDFEIHDYDPVKPQLKFELGI